MGSTSHIPLSPQQRASADFYGTYFWKDYEVQEGTFLKFIVSGMGVENLQGASSLLDIGAGSGKFSILLKRHFPHLKVTAADLSQDNISTIKTNAARAGVEVDACTASALDLPFPDDGFDLVLCAYMLQHTQDPRLGLIESARVLKSGGTALYAIGRDNGLGSVHRRTRRITRLVPEFFRKPSLYPLLPLYWGFTKLLRPHKASNDELMKDLLDWTYNPLQHFVPEPDIQRWFNQSGLSFEHLGYTGLFKSMVVCRGTKRTGKEQ